MDCQLLCCRIQSCSISAYDILHPGKDGKPTKSLIRSTYLIDEDGVIIKALGGVKPKENAAQMSSLRRAVWSSVLRRWIRTGSRRELPAMPYGIG